MDFIVKYTKCPNFVIPFVPILLYYLYQFRYTICTNFIIPFVP